jgi:replicative DNA helicase
MLNEKQIGRMLSYKMQKTTNELYSANLNETNEHLSDNDYNNAIMYAKQIEQYPLYFIDRPGTVDEIEATITFFQETFKDKWLIVILDHTLLTKSKPGEDERTTLANLQRVFIKAKKIGKTTIIQLSQLNREIESVDRLQNPSMQYPTRRDIFGGESVYQASDWVLILHRPEILGITCYGTKKLPTKDMIYLHCIKAREGEPKILSFHNNLKYNTIEEANISNT